VRQVEGRAKGGPKADGGPHARRGEAFPPPFHIVQLIYSDRSVSQGHSGALAKVRGSKNPPGPWSRERVPRSEVPGLGL